MRRMATMEGWVNDELVVGMVASRCCDDLLWGWGRSQGR